MHLGGNHENHNGSYPPWTALNISLKWLTGSYVTVFAKLPPLR